MSPHQHASTLPPPRAYGLAREDLDVAFHSRNPPQLVTELIALCCHATPEQRGSRGNQSAVGETPAPDFSARCHLAWDLPLGARTARLLHIVQLTTEAEAFTATVPCPNAACAQPLELEIPFANLAAHDEGVSTAEAVRVFDAAVETPVELRRPTGRDQAAWRSRDYATTEDAVAAIIGSLLVQRGPADSTTTRATALTAQELQQLSDAMEQVDPLLSFHIETTCPLCQQRATLSLDLEALALAQLSRHRRELLLDIHEFATRYGWTEADVVAIPASRRAEYKRFDRAPREHR